MFGIVPIAAVALCGIVSVAAVALFGIVPIAAVALCEIVSVAAVALYGAVVVAAAVALHIRLLVDSIACGKNPLTF